MIRIAILLPALAGAWLALPATTAAGPTQDQVRFFESRIRPLLADHCVECHGPKNQKSGLRLDTAAGLAKGGDSGEPLVGRDAPDRGRLLRAVRHTDPALQMPPKGKLSDRQIADLAKWVAMGAPFPEPTSPAADPGKHWAFIPPKPPAVPATNPRAVNPIDAFVRAKLDEAGLTPSPPADKLTLIRRATFDLTGLPPTPDEIDAFLADDSPGAWAKVIDRLVASPHYGEKWGRHWLDVARYADSNGLDENIAHGNAWRYRDYVIRSFNADKPYDRFLREQLAGDLLPAKDDAERREQLVATGFLALGPKVLAEVDERKMELDIVDEQVDTLGRAVMALTLGCARCHDHKFDPLTLEDYYGLAGVFLSTKTMESFTKIAKWHEHPLGTPAELKQKADHDAAVAAIRAAAKELAALKDEKAKAGLKKLQDGLAALEKAAPEAPSAMGVTEGKPADTQLLRRGNHLTPGKVVPRSFPAVLVGDKPMSLPKDRSGRKELADWLTRPDHPLTARVMVNRVWRWHFGRGLVASTDNFGLLGEKPSHPELLDFLAVRFVADGWSVKTLHRLILTSETYRRSSAAVPGSATKDPDDRLLSRFPPRRLEAEEMRDALLAVSGLLDRTAGGPAITHVKNREFLFDHTSIDKTGYDSRRRSVYLPVVRNNLYDVFQLFDAPDPAVVTGDRATTTVATQALFWMNSDLVRNAADGLAARLLAASADDTGRVRLLYRVAYGRPPTAAEVARAVKALAGFEADLAAEPDAAKRRARAWGLVCQVVLATNEFVTVN
jgi:mono/diheme cytochrome c family protein